MKPADFRRIALSLEGVEEYSHAGLPAFRVGGRKFASLASQAQGYGNLMLTLELQSEFVEEAPEIFLPIPGGWGRMGPTHVRLAAASEDVLTGALRTAWKLRVEKSDPVISHARPRSVNRFRSLALAACGPRHQVFDGLLRRFSVFKNRKHLLRDGHLHIFLAGEGDGRACR